MQFFKVTKHPPASRPLHWLFPLPGTYFPWLIKWLAASLLPIATQMFSYQRESCPDYCVRNSNLSFLIIISELHFSIALSTAQHLNICFLSLSFSYSIFLIKILVPSRFIWFTTKTVSEIVSNRQKVLCKYLLDEWMTTIWKNQI